MPNAKSRREADRKAASAFEAPAAAIPHPKPAKAAGDKRKGKVKAANLFGPASAAIPEYIWAPPPLLPDKRVADVFAIKQILRLAGDDPGRPGLIDTPSRVIKAWCDCWGAGYRQPAPELRCFPEEGIDYDQMIRVDSINFYSHCEHHLAPFFGTCDVAYLPRKKKGVVGLSKLARVVEHFSRRLQVQERLTAQIADYLLQLSPDVAVRMRATHFCMVSRGVQQQDAKTTTTALRGRFMQAAARSEFLGGK